jgi:hypothetical protein
MTFIHFSDLLPQKTEPFLIFLPKETEIILEIFTSRTGIIPDFSLL